MIWGAPPPAFKATAPIEKPTTGPPGVAAPAITAVRTPSQPLSGPSQPVMISAGITAGIYPEPVTRSARQNVDKIHAPLARGGGQPPPAAPQRDQSDRGHRTPQDDVDDQ